MKKIPQCMFLISLLAAAAGLASGQSKPTPTPAPAPLKLERTGKFDGNVTFPDVEGWTRGEKSQYPTPELGYSVTYSSPQGRVTVYVYNAGFKKIPNELTGPVAEQMRNARSDIKAMVEQGAYQSATEGKVDTLNVGGPTGKVKSLHTEFTFKVSGNELDSETYIFPYNDYFIKIRVTRPKAVGKTEKLQELMKEIDQLFSI